MKDVLKRDIQTKNISHSYLFIGGKEKITAAAKEFALALNCENPNRGQPCYQCKNCRLGETGAFGDLVNLNPEGVYYKVRQVRDFIKKSALSSTSSNCRVFIFNDADAMNNESANALLKTLEEPQGNRVFILLAENRDRILPTIESRCRLVLWQSDEEIKDNLEETADTLNEIYRENVVDTFKRSEKMAKDRDKVYAFFDDCALCLWEMYIGKRKTAFDQQKIFNLIEKTQRANILLERRVNTRLVLEDFFFGVRL